MAPPPDAASGVSFADGGDEEHEAIDGDALEECVRVLHEFIASLRMQVHAGLARIGDALRRRAHEGDGGDRGEADEAGGVGADGAAEGAEALLARIDALRAESDALCDAASADVNRVHREARWVIATDEGKPLPADVRALGDAQAARARVWRPRCEAVRQTVASLYEAWERALRHTETHAQLLGARFDA